MGSDVSHFTTNCAGHSHKTVSIITIFEGKGEPKRGVEPASFNSAYQPSALPPGQAGSHSHRLTKDMRGFQPESRESSAKVRWLKTQPGAVSVHVSGQRPAAGGPTDVTVCRGVVWLSTGPLAVTSHGVRGTEQTTTH